MLTSAQHEPPSPLPRRTYRQPPELLRVVLGLVATNNQGDRQLYSVRPLAVALLFRLSEDAGLCTTLLSPTRGRSCGTFDISNPAISTTRASESRAFSNATDSSLAGKDTSVLTWTSYRSPVLASVRCSMARK